MKRIKWADIVGAVSALNVVGLIMIYFDDRVTLTQGVSILAAISMFIVCYSVMIDLCLGDDKDDS